MAYRQQNYGYGQRGSGRRRGMTGGTLLIALVIAGFSLFKYCSNVQVNEITGEKQHIAINVDQEIQLGIQSAPRMAAQHGGLHPDQEAQDIVDFVGNKIANNSVVRNSDYTYDFHLLADSRSVNAFALPGGQVFITAGLFSRLQTEDQLAGVLGHEIGHVIARHGAERIAKQELTQGLSGAAVIASGDYSTAQAAQMIGNLINMNYGRDQELESDELGVRFMLEAGYDPSALIEVMAILDQATQGNRQPEFFSTHPNPENRVARIEAAIEKYGK